MPDSARLTIVLTDQTTTTTAGQSRFVPTPEQPIGVARPSVQPIQQVSREATRQLSESAQHLEQAAQAGEQSAEAMADASEATGFDAATVANLAASNNLNQSANHLDEVVSHLDEAASQQEAAADSIAEAGAGAEAVAGEPEEDKFAAAKRLGLDDLVEQFKQLDKGLEDLHKAGAGQPTGAGIGGEVPPVGSRAETGAEFAAAERLGLSDLVDQIHANRVSMKALSEAQAETAAASADSGAGLAAMAAELGPLAIVIGAVVVGFYLLYKATKALYDWMDRSVEQLAKWNAQLASATAEAEIIRMMAERRRAAVVGDELARFEVGRARLGSVLTDLVTEFIEPFAGIMASITEIAADIAELVKPVLEIAKYINPIYLLAQGINYILETIRNVIHAIKEWLLGPDQDEATNQALNQLDKLYDSLLNYPFPTNQMPPNVQPGDPFGGLVM